MRSSPRIADNSLESCIISCYWYKYPYSWFPFIGLLHLMLHVAENSLMGYAELIAKLTRQTNLVVRKARRWLGCHMFRDVAGARIYNLLDPDNIDRTVISGSLDRSFQTCSPSNGLMWSRLSRKAFIKNLSWSFSTILSLNFTAWNKRGSYQWLNQKFRIQSIIY